MSKAFAPALACLIALGAALADAGPAAEEVELKNELALRSDEMLATLRDWVERNTGSFHRKGLEAFAELLRAPLAELGFAVEIVPGPTVELPDRGGLATGPLVVAHRQASGPDSKHFLVVGHYDTVFEPDSPFQHFRHPAQSARAYGPGVADMKGGLVAMLYALRALAAHGELERAHWTLLLNADEEIGSLGSRERIEQEAKRADYGFVFEAAHPGGAMVRSRRGVGQFQLRVVGRAAHAGNAHGEGRSAIRTLADQVLRIEALSDSVRGVTANVGEIEGGEKRNIVPARASAQVDVRYDDARGGEELRAQLAKIAATPLVAGTRVELRGDLHRPPKPATPEVEALLAAHAAVARDLGVELPAPGHSGGGTDGSLMQAAGLATLDSLGVVGGGAHTEEEHVEVRSLAERATLAAILWRRLALRASERKVE